MNVVTKPLLPGIERVAVMGLASVEDGEAVPVRDCSSVQGVSTGTVVIGVVKVITGTVVLPARVLVRVMVLRGVIVIVLVVFVLELRDAVIGETRVLGVGYSVSTIVSEMTSVMVTSVSLGVAVPVRLPEPKEPLLVGDGVGGRVPLLAVTGDSEVDDGLYGAVPDGPTIGWLQL